jgi:hypothetical protein
MRRAATFVLLALSGAVLMFGGHFAAFVGRDLPLPYWWAYPILYPLVTVVVVRLRLLSGVVAAAAVCLVPGLYFLALGVFESNWSASSTAIVGIGLSFALAAALGTWVQQRQHHFTDAA